MTQGKLDQIRNVGEQYIKDYLLISKRNLSGNSEASDFGKLTHKYELFSDLSSIKRFLEENNDRPEQEKSALKNLCIFLAVHCVLNATGKIIDDINRIECSFFSKYRNRSYSIRQITSKIAFEKNRENRNLLNTLVNERTRELKHQYYLLYEQIKNRIGELGFRDLEDFYLTFQQPWPELIIKRADEFISDTEYLYKDLLKWFTKRKLLFDPSGLKKRDVDFLVNSYELTDMFPRQPIKYILDTGLGQITESYPDNLSIDDSARPNKVTGVSVFPLDPPAEIVISLAPVRGVSFYAHLMGGYGIAQCYSYVNRDEYFESRYLVDPNLEKIFMNLFSELVYEQKWIKRILGYLPDRDLTRFLYFRKLKEARESAFNTSFMKSIVNADNPLELFDGFREKHIKVLLCDTDEHCYLDLIGNPGHIIEDFTGIAGSSVLKNFLVNKYDEQWWRSGECGEFLRGIWKMGGRADFLFLEKDIKLNPVNINYMYDELDRYI